VDYLLGDRHRPCLYIVRVDVAQSQGTAYYGSDSYSVHRVLVAVLCIRGDATCAEKLGPDLPEYAVTPRHATALSTGSAQQS